jgi:riboflavin kinase / FMN adenylyltransferase
MIVHEGYDKLILKNPVATLGIFDGVHNGHRCLLEYMVKKAEEVNGESVVLTFSPHPREVISDNSAKLNFLSSMEEKITLIDRTGIGHLIIIPFSYELSNKATCEFIKDVLYRRVGAKFLIVGYNQRLGRKGNARKVSELKQSSLWLSALMKGQ